MELQLLHRSLVLLWLAILLPTCTQSSTDGEDNGSNNDNGSPDADADGDADGDGDGESDADADADADTDTDADTNTDTSGSDDTEPEVCATLSTSIEARPVKMMILQDISMSMGYAPGSDTQDPNDNKWIQAQAALSTMLRTYEGDLQFGFDGFPNPATLTSTSNEIILSCNVADPLYQDSALNNAQNIIDIFPTIELEYGTPLYKAMQNFEGDTYAPDFSRRDMDRYLLIVSDGGDTCTENGDYVLSENDSEALAATPELLAELTSRLLADYGVKTFVIGFGIGDGASEDGDALNAIALSGGVLDPAIVNTQDPPYYIQAQNEVELTAALDNIGASVVSCTYGIGEHAPQEVNLDLINVYFNETSPVPQDENCDAGIGWWWTDDSRTEIQFCNYACEHLQSGMVEDISIKIMCSDNDVIVI